MARWRKKVEPSLAPTEQPEALDGHLIALLRERDGQLTVVDLDDGRALQVLDIAWGYDMHDAHAHVTTNCSPGAPGLGLDFFFTNEVTTVLREDGAVLYRR